MTDRQYSSALVAAQFLLGAVVVLSTRRQGWRMAGPALVVAGTALGAWAGAAMGLRRVRVRPEPAQGQALVTRGPYRVLRHPMYTGALLATGGCALMPPLPWRLLAWATLAVLLVTKLRFEETLLRQAFAGYEAYARRTWRLVPFVY